MGDRNEWAALERAYRERGLVLAIGAGVSLQSGVPTWADLLGRIADKVQRRGAFATRGGRLVKDLRKQGFSLAAIASIVRARCDDDAEFATLLRGALYRDFPAKDSKTSTPEGSASIKRACKTNSTLRAVAALCAVAVRDEGATIRYRRNPLVHAIVSFNVDTLLRVYVEARYGRPDGHLLVRSVERASKASDAKKISIYYMHGLLRFDLHANDADKEASDKLVFTEQQYFDFFNDPTGHFNYTFLYLLREHPCLFIGLSMQDDNIRRLLHYSLSERVAAYLDEKGSVSGARQTKPGRDAAATAARVHAEVKSIRHFALLKRCSSAHLNNLTQQSLARLGTRALWVDDYADIHKRLRRMYETAETTPRPNWELVY